MELDLEMLMRGGVFAAFIGATIIQISPIKLNPWTYLARAVGRAINREVIDEVNALKGEVKAIRAEAGEQNAKESRVRILRFGDEILHDVRHSKEHFDQILLDITEYETYCREHPDFKNEMTVLTTARIKATYDNCLINHSFL